MTITNITNDIGVLVVAGPASRDVLQGLTDQDLSNESFKWLTGKEISLAGIALRALRVNYVGELGWELHCPMDRLPDLYEAVWVAGRDHGIANFGTYAVNSLRMEKAYKGWGAEMTNEITMNEADAMRFFAKDKESFVGRDQTLKVSDDGHNIELVYLEVEDGDSDVFGGEPVFFAEKPIGITTSGGYGHYTKTSLGFAYVETAYAKEGQELTLELLGEPRIAKVIRDPVWDPRNERLRA